MPFLVSIEHSQSLVYDNPAPAEYLTKVLNKQDAKVFSWEVMLFQLARWPWVLCAIIDAAKCTMTRTTLEWKITPKGRSNKNAINLSMLLPYILIVTASSIVSVFHASSPYTTGYFCLTLFNILTYVVLVATILAYQTCENRRAIRTLLAFHDLL